MPQIWMTYDELASLLECSSEHASDRAHKERLDRKKSHDGNTRVKLNLALIGLFVARIRAMDQPLEQAIADMRHVHALMRGQPEDQEPLTDRAAIGTAVSATG